MPKANIDQQISALEDRLKQLKLRQQRVDARRRAQTQRRERKAETRRKILIGTVVQAKIQEGVLDAGTLRQWLEVSLSRRADRALFDLDPAPSVP